jgi:NADP-dependent 3-hydroxy acid dehydrogenase YdfG
MSQVWLITGSSRGLGRAFAEAALSSGFLESSKGPVQVLVIDHVEKPPEN